ncbi:carbohydrate kinase [Furfurilactobacillus siliginis]|uniref:ADP-dependent (S)-NAD(P)H-hydrate dehydratase n=1 Tax=Furfurilactobacillus siliginis TaxID=348151 RepID=A0A0R2L484_9LACO|nr:carbohydrate kinase [Furfurilactobacillus siliginis]GEK28382.1 ADP-dependent (S)-NAD(P)H-hydrate dehydratase [Furfurilactobacillus siliginis]
MSIQPITEAMLRNVIAPRLADSHKGTYGRLTLIGGNAQFGGAIIMATTAGIYSGAGLTTTITDPANVTALHTRMPEAMVVDFNNQAKLKELVRGATSIVVGPGLGNDDQGLRILKDVFEVVSEKQVLIIDGSAIDLVATHSLMLPAAKLIFTPHEMEWQRLSGIPIAEQTVANNLQAAAKIGGIIVLKKHHTQIASDGQLFENPGGTPAMATGGMGDTLAGMIGGFTAQFADTLGAVLAAVYIHSQIADDLAHNAYVVLPTQISEEIPWYMKQYSLPKTN